MTDIRRTLHHVQAGGQHLRVHLLRSGAVRLDLDGVTHDEPTLEGALDAAAAWSAVPDALYSALAWELDLSATRGGPWSPPGGPAA
ncbi:hypothetical protein [Deinococcus daejeonensis]|uniref:STAS domain-containing protein n=1 Tax=Deinococcus daejeonensis TaxID=1007098 RepID=A0ABQ2J3C9_9DEIO|nr:hypothetical protein [Deinococcus daejeonensis]GGN38362.1 hypothetical protein GCM10010842_21190 [Deinococcus daejeonensis]